MPIVSLLPEGSSYRKASFQILLARSYWSRKPKRASIEQP
jgi:hypothetical protein